MAGHSKFKNIMHRKNAQDKKRSKVFAQHVRRISIAARENSDIETNIKLKNAILMAKADNVPKDNIDRAIKKSDDNIDGLEEIIYEGYGPCNLAVIVETLTNNRNRTAKELRVLFSRNGGNLCNPGAISYMFDRCGFLKYSKDICDFDTFLDFCLEYDIKDCINNDDGYEVFTEVANFGNVQKLLGTKFEGLLEACLIWVPNVKLDKYEDNLEAINDFLDILDDHDDVQKVFFNL